MIGFIHTPRHATSILIFYGIVIISYLVTLRNLYYNISKCCIHLRKCSPSPAQDLGEPALPVCCKCGCHIPKLPHFCKFLGLFGLAALLAGIFVCVVFLFALVPINNVIDDAPDRVLSINQTVLILIGALLTFKVFQRKKDSLLDYLVKAEDNDQNGNDWKKKSDEEKRKQVANIVLTFFKQQP